MSQLKTNLNNTSENKENSEDLSDEESFQFFKQNTTTKDNDFLNNKRKNSNDENNNVSKMKENKNTESLHDIENNDSNNDKNSKEKKENNSNNNSHDDSISLAEEKIQKNKKKKKSKSNNNNFRTVKTKQICQFYINGACKKGDKCPYSHDAEQIHKKELCKFFLSGKCAKGDKCLYSHDLSEIPCKFFHGLGFCENFQNCQFSHERLNEQELKEFIKANEDFLRETKKKYGRTNLEDIFDQYIKEKDGIEEEYAMLPDFIKNEDKEKENKENNDKIPLGYIVMSNNNKIINELKNFYNMQNIQNIQNTINNNNNKYFNEIYNNNNINSHNNEQILSQNMIANNNINNWYNTNNNNKIILTSLQSLTYPKVNVIKNNKSNYEKEKKEDNTLEINKKVVKEQVSKNDIKNIDDIDNKSTEIEVKKGEEKEEKKILPSVEINPFMNPMLIYNNDINNLF